MKTLSRLVLGALALGMSAGMALAGDKPVLLAIGEENKTSDSILLVGAEEKIAAPVANLAADCSKPGTACGDSCGDDCCRKGRCIAEVGFLYLRPYWKTNPAMFIQQGIPLSLGGIGVGVGGAGPLGGGPVGPRATIDQKDFDDASQVVPRIALGYVGPSGWGSRITWWTFATSQTEIMDNSEGDSVLSSASPQGLAILDFEAFGGGGTAFALEATMHLRFNVFDLEALRVFEDDNGMLMFSAGVRYAHISQDYNAIDYDNFGIGFADTFLRSGHNFNGFGPTVAVQGRWGSTLYVSGTARGALLVGEGKQTVGVSDSESETQLIQETQATSSYDHVIPVVELEAGVGVRGSRGVFAEIGINAQTWFEAGNSSRSDQPLNISNLILAGGQSSDPNLSLFGVYFKAGVTY